MGLSSEQPYHELLLICRLPLPPYSCGVITDAGSSWESRLHPAGNHRVRHEEAEDVKQWSAAVLCDYPCNGNFLKAVGEWRGIQVWPEGSEHAWIGCNMRHSPGDLPHGGAQAWFVAYNQDLQVMIGGQDNTYCTREPVKSN